MGYWSVAVFNSPQTPEYGKILFLGSCILNFGIRNAAQGIWDLTKNWNPESKFS